MRVARLDHFTLRSERLEESRQFFEDVVGLVVGLRPPFDFPGYWLYPAEEPLPLVHLAKVDANDEGLRQYLGDRPTGVGGTLDHLAFRCSDLPSFEARLSRLTLPCQRRTVPSVGEHQVFVQDPNGITFEFIFPMTECASWTVDAAGVDQQPLNETIEK